MRHGPDIVAIILALAFTVCFFWILVNPVQMQEAGVLALKDIWLVIVGALAGYIAKGKEPPKG